MTAAGRGVAVVLMLVGIGPLGVVTANIASYFVTKDDRADQAQRQVLLERLERMEQLLEAIAFRADIAPDDARDQDATGTNGRGRTAANP